MPGTVTRTAPRAPARPAVEVVIAHELCEVDAAGAPYRQRSEQIVRALQDGVHSLPAPAGPGLALLHVVRGARLETTGGRSLFVLARPLRRGETASLAYERLFAADVPGGAFRPTWEQPVARAELRVRFAVRRAWALRWTLWSDTGPGTAVVAEEQVPLDADLGAHRYLDPTQPSAGFGWTCPASLDRGHQERVTVPSRPA